MPDSLGDRVKAYEAVFNQKYVPKSPLIIRIDGKAFHTYTKGFDKPYSGVLMEAMEYATVQTAKHIQGFKLAYTQSDEATFLLTDYDTFETSSWFGYEVNKVVSISASVFTANFNKFMDRQGYQGKIAYFDSRAFSVPEADVANVFIWRQRDWERNSIQMLARDTFSQKQLHGKNVTQLNEMIEAERGWGWERLSNRIKYGTFVEADFSSTHERETYHTLQARIEASLVKGEL